MPVKIRLARRGRKKQPYYHIVVADARAPRDGRFIEQIGSYNPMTKPASIEIDRDRAYEWLKDGAQPTDTVRAILRFTGVLYKKHLMRGVAKGALTQEEADAKLESWIADKDAKVNARKEEAKADKAAHHAMVAGAVPAVKAPKEVVVEDTHVRKEQLTLAEELELKGKAEAEASAAPTEDAAVKAETPVAESTDTPEAEPAKKETVAETVESPAAEVAEKVEEVAEKAEAVVEETAAVVEETTEAVVEETTAAVEETTEAVVEETEAAVETVVESEPVEAAVEAVEAQAAEAKEDAAEVAEGDK